MQSHFPHGRAFVAESGEHCGALRAGASGWHSPAALKHTSSSADGPPRAGGVNRWRRFCSDNIQLLFTSHSVKPSSHTFRQIHSNTEQCLFHCTRTRSVCCYLHLKLLECDFIWFMIEGFCLSLQSFFFKYLNICGFWFLVLLVYLSINNKINKK